MNAKDVIRHNMQVARMATARLLEDFTDAEFLERPVPGANHVAWQLGHLISAERHFLEAIRPGSSPALPEGFAEKHVTDTAGKDDPADFYPRAEYLRLYDEMRKASLAVLDELPDEDLDKEAAGLPPFAPTIGAALTMMGAHETMHTGQYTCLRRKLGKPNVF